MPVVLPDTPERTNQTMFFMAKAAYELCTKAIEISEERPLTEKEEIFHLQEAYTHLGLAYYLKALRDSLEVEVEDPPHSLYSFCLQRSSRCKEGVDAIDAGETHVAGIELKGDKHKEDIRNLFIVAGLSYLHTAGVIRVRLGIK